MKRVRIWIVICFSALFLYVLLANCNSCLRIDDGVTQSTFGWGDKVSSNKVFQTDNSLQVIWYKNDVYMHNDIRDATFVADDDQVVFIGSLDRTSYPEIIGLSSETGTLKYQIPQAGASGSSMSYAAGYFCTGHTGSARIACYKAENGELLWTDRHWRTKRHVSYLKQVGTTLYATTDPSDSYAIDVLTGEVLDEVNTSELHDIFWLQDDTIYVREGLGAFAAYKENDVLWKVNIQDGIYTLPAESERVVFIKSGRGTVGDVIGTVTAIRKSDGTILWERQNIVGSVGVSQGYVSFFTLDNELVVVNEMTGVVISRGFFEPKFEVERDLYIGSSNFAVVSTQTKIFAYFGDSHQLFAFEFIPPEIGE